MINFKNIKVQLNLFLIAFAAFLFLKEPDTAFLTGLGWGVLFCVLIETILLLLKTKKFQITSSAIISGLIIGFVLSSGSPWWMFLAVAFLTVGLKRILQFHGKNILNPAACGIFFAVLLLKATTEWKGAYAWYILVPAGIYFAYKIRKLEVVVGYFLMALALFTPQVIRQGAPLWDIFGYFNYFFIFIMLVEPKTTPAQLWPKTLFGAGAALVIFLLTESGFRYEPELYALLVMNTLVPWISKISNLKFQIKKQPSEGAHS